MQFIDLAAQQNRIRDRIDAAIAGVLDHGKYIHGPEVAALEADLAQFCGAGHVIACANGTDALQLALMALGIRPGDAVFVPSFTFAATAEVVPMVGATPVFVDVDEVSFNICVQSLHRAIEHAVDQGLRPACVIPVDLFGVPAHYDALQDVADRYDMRVISDSAQGFGARYGNRRSGTFGDISTTSFFPAKPLGCYGDGGAVFTDNATYAELMRSYRVHGKGDHKYDNARLGLSSRLDTLQAAILLEKLAIYEDEIKARQEVAARYNEALKDSVFATPYVPEGSQSVWAQYTLRASDGETRDAAIAALKEAGIPSVVYYPLPLHLQTAYRDYPRDPSGIATSETLAKTVFSLPMHPYLSADDQARVTEILKNL